MSQAAPGLSPIFTKERPASTIIFFKNAQCNLPSKTVLGVWVYEMQWDKVKLTASRAASLSKPTQFSATCFP